MFNYIIAGEVLKLQNIAIFIGLRCFQWCQYSSSGTYAASAPSYKYKSPVLPRIICIGVLYAAGKMAHCLLFYNSFIRPLLQ